MSKYIAESFYTCLFKITHNLQELTSEALQEIDSRKDGKVEVLDVKFNKRKTRSLAEIQANKPQSKEQEVKEISSQKISENITSSGLNPDPKEVSNPATLGAIVEGAMSALWLSCSIIL